MQERIKFLICLHKAYLDEGMGLTNYIKPLLYFSGAFLTLERMLVSAVFLGVGYILFSYLFGLWWYKSRMKTYSIEVSNIFNLFVGEMRKELIYNAKKDKSPKVR
jgi:hypothetical protein